MKICTKCNEAKTEIHFSFKDKAKEKRSTICKACHNTYVREKQYKTYKKKHVRNVRSNTLRLQKKIHEYLKVHPCVDCEESDPIVLEFDHVKGEKVSTISQMAINGISWGKILAEINKCEVRCANCHRRRTAEQQGWRIYKSIAG